MYRVSVFMLKQLQAYKTDFWNLQCDQHLAHSLKLKKEKTAVKHIMSVVQP